MKQFDTTRPEFAPYGFTCERWTPVAMPRADRHSEIELNFLASGSLTYLVGGHRDTIHPGQMGLFWAAIPHQIVEFDGDDPYFVVTLPLNEFMRSGVDADIVNRTLQGEVLVSSVQDERDLASFQRWESDLASRDPALARAAQLEIQARLLRFAHDKSIGGTAEPVDDLSTADQLACYIARHFYQPLTSASIAKAVDLHPNYAMSLFRKTFGISITSFITQHRLSEAQRLLVTTNRSVLDVSLASGFQSLSRFNEVFRKVCGCSPRKFRANHRVT